MQVLKRRKNKQIALSLFQSSWHVLSIQNGEVRSCVVFPSWTFIPESSKIMSHCFSNIHFFSSALSRVASALLSSGISRALCVAGSCLEPESAGMCFSPRVVMGLNWCFHILMPQSLRTNSRKWEGSWCGMGVAGFGPEPRGCWWSSLESVSQGKGQRPQRCISNHNLQKPDWPFVPLNLWARKLRSREWKWLALGSPIQLAVKPQCKSGLQTPTWFCFCFCFFWHPDLNLEWMQLSTILHDSIFLFSVSLMAL